tara:strand:- start:10109 stop:12457 length:2349 start_codon:yes stop_codon:yes gene_type:complete
MATVIQLKRTNTATLPTANNGSLEHGEMAYLYDTSSTALSAGQNGRRLYIGNPNGNNQTPIKVGGQYYTDMLEHAHGTLTESAAIIADANKKIDNLKVDVMDFDGSTITTESGNGLTLNPATSVSIKGAYTLPTADGTAGQAIMTDGSGAATFQTIGTNLTIKGDATTTDSIALLTETLSVEGDAATGIATTVGANKITVSGTNASTTAKGVAKFAAADFAVSAEGEVTLNQTTLEESVEDYINGSLTAGTGMATAYDDTAGTITISGTDATTTAKGIASFGTTDFSVTAGAVTIKTGGVSNAQLAGDIANGKLTNSTISIDADTGTTNAVDLGDTLVVTGGEGIDTAVSGDTLTITGELATSANKGIASFSGDDFTVTDGVVAIKSTGILAAQISNNAVTTDKILNANVTNAKLANPTTTLGTSTLTLGAATTDIAGITSLGVGTLTVTTNNIATSSGNLVLNPTGNISANSNRIVDVSNPTAANDASNKTYVDSVAQGLAIKNACAAATTADLSGTYNNGTSGVGATITITADSIAVLDGVTLQVGDRILVKNQTNLVENGIYTYTNTSTLTRATDADTTAELSAGTFFFVQSGTLAGDNGFVQTEIVNNIGSGANSNIKYTQFSGAGQIVAGAAITKTGNQLDIGVDGSSIEVTADALNVKALGITNAMLAGSIANAKLSNSSVTINSQSLALGASLTLNADNIAEASSPTNQYFTNTRARSAVSIGAGTGLAYVTSTGVISGVDASTSAKGVAQFDSNDFAVSSGVVTVKEVDGGTYT